MTANASITVFTATKLASNTYSNHGYDPLAKILKKLEIIASSVLEQFAFTLYAVDT